MKFKAARDFSTIKKNIVDLYGPVFEIIYDQGYVVVKGDLHDYRTRDRLFEIITSKKVGG